MTPKDGWAEQEPDLWWKDVVDNIHAAMEEAGASPNEVLAVGVGGQMHATTPLRRDGALLSHISN
jgi:xylulokinase